MRPGPQAHGAHGGRGGRGGRHCCCCVISLSVCLRVQVATRKAYGMALAKLGRYNDRMVVLDGDTKNSTFSELFKNEHPNRYMECYIAEQNMVKTVWPTQ